MSEFIPYGKSHTIQISDKEMYAFEPLVSDAIYKYREQIADLRKKLGIPSEYPDTLSMLSEIQELEGKIVILNDLFEQLDL